MPAPSPADGSLPADPKILAGLARVAAALARTPLGVVTLAERDGQRLLAHGGEAAAPAADVVARVEELCAAVAERDGAVSLERVPGGAPPVLGFLGVPVRTRAGVAGVLAVLSPESRAWSGDDALVLCELADAAAAELERARLESEHVEITASARRIEARYGRLLQNASVGIYATDAQGRFVEVNGAGAGILGRPVEDALRMNFRDVVAPEDREVVTQAFLERVAGVRQAAELEFRVIRPTGERRILRVCSAPVVEGGAVVGTQGVARDVTEDRAREMQFRRAERMASVAPLLSGVCHELNNPLTSIKSFAELLLLDERTEEDREALEIVQREAHRAAKIVTDLRSVARQSQETGTERAMVDLNGVVRHVLEARSDSLAGAEVQADLEEGLPPLWAVRLHIEQVALHLLSNAVQAMQEQEGPRVLAFRTYAGGLGAVLQVEDSGPGIHPDHLDRIFDPFWTTRRAGEGTGLGLSLVNGIVADHGGRIRVDSTPGSGARFAVEFPISLGPPQALGPTDAATGATRRLRVLVVDDEPAIRYSLTRYMERRGHHVEEASEGGAALRLLDEAGEHPFDVIVADLRMPGLNGGELLRRLRQRGGDLEDRLIFITGDTDSSDLQAGTDFGGVPLVQKPFELAEIAQIVEVHAGMASV